MCVSHIRSSIVNYRASIILTAIRCIADFASENEHGHVGATGRIREQRESRRISIIHAKAFHKRKLQACDADKQRITEC